MADVHKVAAGRVDGGRVRGEGSRVLVDRIWPRGLSKENTDLDDWRKKGAPSTELRRWYDHDPERFEEFGRRYRTEFEEPEHAETLEHPHAVARHGNLLLLTAAKHDGASEATVLADLIQANPVSW